MAIIDELLVGLGFQYDPKEMKRFKEDVEKTTSVIKELATAAVAGAAAITGLTVASTQASDEQGKLADEIGETVGRIDALQFAMDRSGDSSENLSTSLRDLSRRASEAARGTGEALEIFSILGISSTSLSGGLKPASELMIEISDSFQNLSKAKQIEFADKLGVKDSIRLLQSGPEAIRDLISEAEALGVTTEEDAKIAAEFQDSLTNLWKSVKSGARILTRELAPILKSVMDSTVEWWKANRQLIEQNLPEWIDKATMAMKLLTLATGVWLSMRLVTHIAALITAFKGLSVAALVANAAALLLPALIAGSVTALALLAEDAKVFFEGGESFIGDMIEKYPKWEIALRSVALVFGTLADLTTSILEGWSSIFDLFTVDALKDLGKYLPGFLSNVREGAIATTVKAAEAAPSFLDEVGRSVRNTSPTLVEKMDIIIQGGADTAENIANAVFDVFQQSSQDLNTAVDQ